MQKVDIYLERKNVFPYFVSPFSNCVENVVDDHRHPQEVLQLIYFPVWIAAMENKKYSLAGWRAVSEEGAQPLTWVPPPAKERSSWCSSQEQAQPSRARLPTGLLFQVLAKARCQAEPESASSPLLGYTKRLVQLGEKLLQFFRNCTRFWLKRLGPWLGFCVLHVCFDVLAWIPG